MTDMDKVRQFADMLEERGLADGNTHWVDYSNDDDEPMADLVLHFAKRCAARFTFDGDGKLISMEEERF